MHLIIATSEGGNIPVIFPWWFAYLAPVLEQGAGIGKVSILPALLSIPIVVLISMFAISLARRHLRQEGVNFQYLKLNAKTQQTKEEIDNPECNVPFERDNESIKLKALSVDFSDSYHAKKLIPIVIIAIALMGLYIFLG